jgi:NAD(P)-dependent dehydrogenase (short-subunit alcohol dehydrogenase family)
MTSDPARVLVVGAQGTLGRLCVEALRREGFSVTRGGRRREDLPDFRLVDLDHAESLREGLAGFDLVVSTVRHPTQAAERVVLHEGGILLNVASLSLGDRAELTRDDGEHRGLVVVHAGVAPGVHTLVLKDMLARHPTADGVEIAMCFSLVQASGPAGTVDFAYPALSGARRHPTRVFAFAEPIGPRRCMLIGGPEIGFFGEVAHGRTGRVYFTVLQRPALTAFLAMNATHLLSRLPLRAFQLGRGWTSKRTTREPRRDIVAVTNGDRTLDACTVAGSGDYLMTASATAVFAQALLARPTSRTPSAGVWGAEELFDLLDVQHGFEASGITFTPFAAS